MLTWINISNTRLQRRLDDFYSLSCPVCMFPPRCMWRNLKKATSPNPLRAPKVERSPQQSAVSTGTQGCLHLSGNKLLRVWTLHSLLLVGRYGTKHQYQSLLMSPCIKATKSGYTHFMGTNICTKDKELIINHLQPSIIVWPVCMEKPFPESSDPGVHFYFLTKIYLTHFNF